MRQLADYVIGAALDLDYDSPGSAAAVNRADCPNRRDLLSYQRTGRKLHPHVVEIDPEFLSVDAEMPSEPASMYGEPQLDRAVLTFNRRPGDNRGARYRGTRRHRYQYEPREHRKRRSRHCEPPRPRPGGDPAMLPAIGLALTALLFVSRTILGAQPRDHPRERIERLDRCHPFDLGRTQLLDHAALGRREEIHLGHRAAALGAMREARLPGVIK